MTTSLTDYSHSLDFDTYCWTHGSAQISTIHVARCSFSTGRRVSRPWDVL